MTDARQFYFKVALYGETKGCVHYETGFIAAKTAGDAFADCEEYYGSDLIGAYIELATDCAVMLVDESVCHDIMEDQF